MSDFGKLLRKFRNRSGLSQRAMARLVDVDTSYISRLERGKRDIPSRILALRFAEVLKLSQKELELWLISAGYISPRIQNLANKRDERLMEVISGLEDNIS